MASRQAIGRCFDLLESAGFLAPDGWRQPKTPDGDARRAAARRATGEAWELALGHAGVDDATLMTAVATLMAHTAERYWPTPGVLIGCIRTPDAKHNREGAADAALAELRARARRWQRPPVSPSDPDVDVLPASPVMILDRFNLGRQRPATLPDGTPLVRPERRVDGRWRVAGDELRQTDPGAEAAVWRVLNAIGGVDVLRAADGDENTAAWGAYAATWRRQWAAMADDEEHSRRLIGTSDDLTRLADRADRQAMLKMRDAIGMVEASTRR
jgi:hypothetical protein